MIGLRDRLQRRTIPRLVVALSTVDGPARLAAAARRASGKPGRVKLFAAFDDPQGAIALLGLQRRLENRDVDLEILPVVERGIENDPSVAAKRSYAAVDAARLARRAGLTFSRRDPLDAAEVAFLAGWTASIGDGGTRVAFAAAAFRLLWLESEGVVPRDRCRAIWGEVVGGAAPSEADGAAAVARNEARMRRRGLYDTPVALFGGEWHFAHERLEQIGLGLDRLGWRAGL